VFSEPSNVGVGGLGRHQIHQPRAQALKAGGVGFRREILPPAQGVLEHPRGLFGKSAPVRGRIGLIHLVQFAQKMGETNYRLDYTAKPLRLAKRRVAEEFREKYRWRSGIEATNAPLKRVLRIGRLRVRRLARVRHAVMLKALGWNLKQAVRARKARMGAAFQRRTVWKWVRTICLSRIHPVAGLSGGSMHREMSFCLQLAA